MSARAEFQGVEIQHLPEDRCRARVRLGRKLSARLQQTYVGVAEGAWSPLEELRCTARATLQALERSFQLSEGTLTLLDIKTVESFDCPAVIVAVDAHDEQLRQRFVGFCEVRSDAATAAARSVLNATNRLLHFRYSAGDPTSESDSGR